MYKKSNYTVNEFLQSNDNVSSIRNMAVIAHVDHGKSTLVDNLLAQAGFLAQDSVGSTLTDYDEQERKRGITINNASISLFFKNHLFNLIDTPGHVDFGSEVAKSLRSIDGALLVMDAVEGVMVQTESVISQALKENVKLVLFINKIDRMISEQKLDAQEVYQKLLKNIAQVNTLIKKFLDCEEDYFQLNRNVIFGSALNKWAFTITKLQEHNDKFSVFVDKISKKESLPERYNLAEVVLDACIKLIPDPMSRHKERITKIFDKETLAKDPSFVEDPLNSGFRGVVTDINYDKILGLIHTVRVVSGTYDKTKKLYSSQNEYSNFIKKPTKLSVMMINKYEEVENCLPGSLIVFHGCDIKNTGTTLTQVENDCIIFPEIVYMREPIFSLAIWPEKLSQTTKMIEAIKILCMEDPTLEFKYDDAAKQFTLAGVGALHLEVTLKKLELSHGIVVKTGEPNIPYIETLNDNTKNSETVSVRTPNKHNDFRFYIFNLPKNITKRLLNKDISAKTLNIELEKEGLDKDFAKDAVKILDNGNIYFDQTHGADFMEECKTLLGKSLSFSLSRGTKLNNPLKGIGVVITFAKIHMDALHRTEIQLRAAFRAGLEEILQKTNPSIIKEPIMKLSVRAPITHVNKVSTVVNNKRGYLIETIEEDIGSYVNLVYMIPLSETMDLSTILMSATEGRAIFFMDFEEFCQVPDNILLKILKTEKDQT